MVMTDTELAYAIQQITGWVVFAFFMTTLAVALRVTWRRFI